MKLGATITSERGKPVIKTGNEYLVAGFSHSEKRLEKLRVYVKNEGVFTHYILHIYGSRPVIYTYDEMGNRRGIAMQDIARLTDEAIIESKKTIGSLKR